MKIVEVDHWATGVRGQETVRLIPHFGDRVECTASEDMARQEYKLESDIAYQMARFGQGMPHQHGEFDFDRADLQQALAAVEEATQAFQRLPKVVRDRYRSWLAAGLNADLSALSPAASPPAGEASA